MAPSNDPPEIPSLKPQGKDDEKKGGGGPLSSLSRGSSPAPEAGGTPAGKPGGSGFRFPSLGSSSEGSTPNVRVRGLSGGSTLIDRLKNLRKKDMIFILAGLCTLGTAPLAEHLLMAPEDQTGQLQQGFDSKGPLFQDGSSVYDPGSGIGSPGGLVGQGSDVITPLNVRDPSNLVMSPGAQKKADAVVTPPPPPPSASSQPDWKDVLRDSAKAGATKGLQAAAKLPMPNVKLAGAIRGLSALSGGGGGSGASFALPALSAQHAPNHAADSNALTRSAAAPGYRGAAGLRSPMSSGASEALRAAGMRQADIFNKGGSAANALDTAAREAVPTGGGPGQSGGRPGDGDATKNPGGNNNKENKQLGESLAYLRAKMEMEKAVDLKWKEKEWNQFGRSKEIQEAAIKMGFDMFGKFAQAAFVDPLANAIGQAVAGAGTPAWVTCDGGFSIPYAKVASGKFALLANGDLVQNVGTGSGNTSPVTIAHNCKKLGGSGSDTPAGAKTEHWSGQQPAAGGPGSQAMGGEAQHARDQAAALQQSRNNVSARLSEISQICSNSAITGDNLTRCKALQQTAQDVQDGLDKLISGSNKLASAWDHLKTASTKMQNEAGSLSAADSNLNDAYQNLNNAYQLLSLSQGQGGRTKPDFNGADKAIGAAKDLLKSGGDNHTAGQKLVGTVNDEMASAESDGKSANEDLKAGTAKIVNAKAPAAMPADQAQATTSHYNDYVGYVNDEVKDATQKMQDLNTRYASWSSNDQQAQQAKLKLQGYLKTPTGQTDPNFPVPATAGTMPQNDGGAVRWSYKPMPLNEQGLIGTGDASASLLHTSAANAYTQAGVAAACNDPQSATCGTAIQTYTTAFDGQVKKPVTDTGTNVSDAVTHVGQASSLTQALGTTIQQAAPPPSGVAPAPTTAAPAATTPTDT